MGTGQNGWSRRGFLAASGALFTSSALPLPALAADDAVLDWPAAEVVTGIKRGDITAEKYANALLDRCKALKTLNAFISIDENAVLEAARNVDRARSLGRELGGLSGLPIAVKDSIATTALPTTVGTRSLRDFRPEADAAVWQRLSQAGAILLGKTNLHELSLGWTSANQVFGPVRNPYDPSRIPGGSSGGTGTAVAARMAPVGLGADTNGSIRIPAAFCGIAGLRPTHGRYPGAGVMPLAPTLDTVGPMARKVADLCLLDSAITGEAPVTTPADLRSIRIGISREHYFSDLDSGVQRALEDAMARLRQAGVTIVEAEIPNLATLVGGANVPIIYYEARRSIARFLSDQHAPVDFAQLVAQLSPEIKKQVDEWVVEGAPREVPEQAYRDAIQKHRPALQAAWRDYFGEHRLNAVLSPVVRMPAPPIPQPPTSPGFDVEIGGKLVPARIAFARNIAPSSTAGLPSIVIPGGMSSGLPVGIELDGPIGTDRDLLALGLAVEHVLGPVPAPKA